MDPKILIIDGHPVYVPNRSVPFLQELGFRKIYSAPTGEQGIELAKIKKPDLVILSARLPDQSSLEVCEKVKGLHPEVKILVQKGLFEEEEMVQEFKAKGANIVLDRLEKNWQPFKEAIFKLLPNKAPVS